jgi:hypothetical protein
MEPAAIRSRLRIVRSVFAWVVIAAVALVALVFNLGLVSVVLAAIILVLIVYRVAREASISRARARADQARIDQSSPGVAAGFTTIGIGGIILQILIVLAIDGFIAVNIAGRSHFDAHAAVLVAIALVLTVFVIVVAALTFRLRGQQRHGMAVLAAQP